MSHDCRQMPLSDSVNNISMYFIVFLYTDVIRLTIVIPFRMIAFLYISVVTYLLSIRTQGCIMLALQHYLTTNLKLTHIEIPDI